MMILNIDDAEQAVLLSALRFLREALIDDALDDPTADHSDQVPGLDQLITRIDNLS